MNTQAKINVTSLLCPGLRDFTIHNAIDRIRETGDLFLGVMGEGIGLTVTVKNAQACFLDFSSTGNDQSQSIIDS